MNVFVGIVVIVVLFVAFLFVRSRKAGGNVRPDEHSREQQSLDSQFHAVSIRFANNACQASKDMEGRRFLSSAAPKIPLADCDALECRCKFAHHSDRRTRDDRRSPYGHSGLGGGSTGTFRKEQRENSDRRKKKTDDLY